MTPHYADDWLTVYHGDSRAVLAELPAESVHCVVTSPPYWGLRDYGTAAWRGGDPECSHLPDAETLERQNGRASTLVGSTTHQKAAAIARHRCKCGAIRQDSQLGLEPTPEQYVENMVAVFREVRRVLRSDGTVWLNLGDSYAAQRSGSAQPAQTIAGHGRDEPVNGSAHRNASAVGLKHKDLVGIPWRVAFALQADGWYLRSDIIWSKPNPMPESVTDRPTKSHEYLFLLSKAARYYYDADAVREPHTESTLNRIEYGLNHRHPDNVGVGIPPVNTDRMGERFANPSGRNMRSVWSIATAPYPGAHFATFPPKLVEPCIKAGTSERGVCPECGAPWVREVEREPEAKDRWGGPSLSQAEGTVLGRKTEPHGGLTRDHYQRTSTTGWKPSCIHGHWYPCDCGKCPPYTEPPVPATVLDPFAGSGTTGMVAQSLSRRAVLIDLSMDYLGQLMERNRHVPLGI